MLMSIYVGVGLALIVTAVMPDLVRYGSLAIGEPRVAMLTPPLILSAALAVGVRILMTIPTDMPARWVFQTTTLHPRRIDAAVHKTLLLIVLPPVVSLAGISGWMLWGPAIAWRHAVYCAALAFLLCELLLLRFRGVPLTRPYVAGRSQFHLLWAFYFSAFLTYTYSAAALELTLFGPDPSRAAHRERRLCSPRADGVDRQEGEGPRMGRRAVRGGSARPDVQRLQPDRDLRRPVGFDRAAPRGEHCQPHPSRSRLRPCWGLRRSGKALGTSQGVPYGSGGLDVS